LWPDIAIQLGLASLVFGLSVGAFAIGQMGGGDVKLLGALALWLPMQPLVGMLMLMSLVGGALTIIMVAERWTQLRGGLRGLPWRTIGPVILGVLALAMLVYAGRGGIGATFSPRPIATLAVAMTLLAGIGALLLAGARAARRHGIVPETPYGVAIAISTLLILREPIFNQFG
jgi:Flp pilus assembly protein protease CpaA